MSFHRKAIEFIEFVKLESQNQLKVVQRKERTGRAALKLRAYGSEGLLRGKAESEKANVINRK